MKTHTIRKTKAGLRIIKFTPKFMMKLKKAGWWASSLYMCRMEKLLGSIDPHEYKYDWDQSQELNMFFGKIETRFNFQYLMAERLFRDGYFGNMCFSTFSSSEQELEFLTHFWDNYLAKGVGTSTI